MFFVSRKRLGALVLAIGLLGGVSCVGTPASQSPKMGEASPEIGSAIRSIVVAGEISDLLRPKFSDYKLYVDDFYRPAGYAPAWTKRGAPTSQAQSLIAELQRAESKGLNAEDYDGPRWEERLKRLSGSVPAEAQARFDVALTVCLMRYVSDLRIGRVNPQHVNFDLDLGPKKYDLAVFIREKLVDSSDPRSELNGIEPPFAGYKRTLEAFQRYRELSQRDNHEQLPVPAKPINPGSPYEGTLRLRQLLEAFGDLRNASQPTNSKLYDESLAGAVQRFQKRHGLQPDGRLGATTVKELNTPLSFRVEQLRLTLERWRWVPQEFPQPPIIVNIPEFRLRAYDSDGKVGFASNVIVGKAYRHQTPVFEKEMQFIVLRPYWNVPPSIQRSEIVPAIRRNDHYIADKGYEVTTRNGTVVTSGSISDEMLARLSSGELSIRQKPGPTNALGLVKLMFPNEYNVYLHSTPSAQLFSQVRRDFSHGCIRVQQAAELAAWVLRDKPEWTVERIRAAMETGKNNVQVNLTRPVPVLILYGTAVVDEEHQVHFFQDIYGHDVSLKQALAKQSPAPN